MTDLYFVVKLTWIQSHNKQKLRFMSIKMAALTSLRKPKESFFQISKKWNLHKTKNLMKVINPPAAVFQFIVYTSWRVFLNTADSSQIWAKKSTRTPPGGRVLSPTCFPRTSTHPGTRRPSCWASAERRRSSWTSSGWPASSGWLGTNSTPWSSTER